MPPARRGGIHRVIEASAVATPASAARGTKSDESVAQVEENDAQAEGLRTHPEIPVPDMEEDGPPLEVILADEGRESPVPTEPTPNRDPGEALVESGPLPPLEDLVARIPNEVKERLDGLFRAHFVKVIRVPPSVLSMGAGSGKPKQ